MQRFAGTVTLVTGASRGIGRAVAERVLAEGGHVVLTARKPEPLAEAAAALRGSGAPGTVHAVAGRADDPDHREEVLALLQREHGRLDHLVNNAGINPAYGPALDVEPAVVRKILDVNVVSAMEWTRTAVAAGLGRDGAGSVVNVGSYAGLRASPGIAFYGVSKAALLALTTQLAYELAPKVRVNAVAPAVVKTDFARALYDGREERVAAGYPLRRLGVPEDVAGPVVFLLSQDAAWITGQTVVVDGGATIAPVAEGEHG